MKNGTDSSEAEKFLKTKKEEMGNASLFALTSEFIGLKRSLTGYSVISRNLTCELPLVKSVSRARR